MHDEHSRSQNELWLARQLQQAARLEQPGFSESLHQRIMQAVRPTAADSTVPDLNASRRCARQHGARWLTAAWLTSAAALLTMVIASRWFAGPADTTGPQPPQSAVAQSATIQPAHHASEAIGTVDSKPAKSSSANVAPDDIASAAANYSFDDLSRDAQATAHVLVDQLPFETPTDEWGL